MKRIKIFIVTAFILILIYYFHPGSINVEKRIELAVLEQNGTDLLWRSLRYVPDYVSERFDINMYIEWDNAKVYCVNYSHKSQFYSFYYFVDINGDLKNLKNGFLTKSSKKYDLVELIDTKTFNQIGRHFAWSERESTYNFSVLLSNFCEQEYNFSLDNIEDYDVIIRSYPIVKEKEIILNPILSRNRIQHLLRKKEYNTFYHWFYDQGLMKFTYNFSDGEIKSISSTFIGNLGNELIHL